MLDAGLLLPVELDQLTTRDCLSSVGVDTVRECALFPIFDKSCETFRQLKSLEFRLALEGKLSQRMTRSMATRAGFLSKQGR